MERQGRARGATNDMRLRESMAQELQNRWKFLPGNFNAVMSAGEYSINTLVTRDASGQSITHVDQAKKGWRVEYDSMFV